MADVLVVRLVGLRNLKLPSATSFDGVYCKLLIKESEDHSHVTPLIFRNQADGDQSADSFAASFHDELLYWPMISRSSVGSKDLLHIKVRACNTTLLRSSMQLGNPHLGVVSLKLKQTVSQGAYDNIAWYPLSPYKGSSTTALGEISLAVYWCPAMDAPIDDSPHQRRAKKVSLSRSFIKRLKMKQTLADRGFDEALTPNDASVRKEDTWLSTNYSDYETDEDDETVNLLPKAAQFGEEYSKVEVIVHEAKGIRAADANGKSDPYVVIQCRGITRKTPHKKATLEPKWDYSFSMSGRNAELIDVDDEINFTLFDYDLGRTSDELGCIIIPLWSLNEHSSKPLWYEINPTDKMIKSNRYNPTVLSSPKKRKSFGSDSLGDEHSSALGWMKITVKYSKPTFDPYPTPLHAQSNRYASFNYPPVENGTNTDAKGTLDISSNSLEAYTESRVRSLSVLKSEKPVLRVRVLQARNLAAADANGKSDPYCLVECKKESYRTAVVKKDLHPTWDQTFEFGHNDYITEDDVIKFTIKDKDFGIRDMADDHLGSLEIPIWSILYSKDGTVKPTWWSLDSSKYTSPGEINIMIHYDHPTLHVSKQKRDIYKGKVWLYECRITVMAARNLLAADKGRTSDPYCIVKCGDTQYKTRVVKKNLSPVWNQRFTFNKSSGSNARNGLGRKDHIHVAVMDHDPGPRTVDDPLGKVELDLSYIIDKMGYIDAKGKEWTSWFHIKESDGMGAVEEESAAWNKSENTLGSKIKTALKISKPHFSMNNANEKAKNAAKTAKNKAANLSAKVNETASKLRTMSFDSDYGYKDVMNSLNPMENLLALTSADETQNENKNLGSIRLKFHLRPIDETRMMKSNKLLIRIHKVRGFASINGSSDKFPLYPHLPTIVYIKLTVGLHQKTTRTVQFLKHNGGIAVLNDQVLFTEDIDWLLQRAKKELAKSVECSEGLVVLTLCDGHTDKVLASLRYSLLDILNHMNENFDEVNQCKYTSTTYGRPDNIGRRWFAMNPAPRFEKLGVQINPEIQIRFQLTEIEEELLPMLGHFHIRLLNMKMLTQGYHHELRCVLKYKDHAIPSTAIIGDINPIFGPDEVFGFSVTDMYTPLKIEVWDQKSSESEQKGHSKWGKLLASTTLTTFELLELEAQMLYSEFSWMKPVHVPPIKLKLHDKTGKLKGNLWAEARYVEELSGILAPNPNPSRRPENSFSIAKFKSETVRTQRLMASFGSFFVLVGQLLDWEHPIKTTGVLIFICICCVIEWYFERILFVFPLMALVHVINRHSDRFTRKFLSGFQDSVDEESVTARLRVGIIKCRNLLPADDNGLADVHARVSMKTTPASRKLHTVGWTRTVPSTLNPKFYSSKHGFGIAHHKHLRNPHSIMESTSLIEWNSSDISVSGNKNNSALRMYSNIPAFEVHVRKLLINSPLLAVTINMAQDLKDADCGRNLSDPFITCRILVNQGNDMYENGEKHSTKVIKNTLNPQWDEQFVFGKNSMISKDDSMELLIYDKDEFKDDLIGRILIPLADIERRFHSDASLDIDQVVGDDDGLSIVGSTTVAHWIPVGSPEGDSEVGLVTSGSTTKYGKILMSMTWLDFSKIHKFHRKKKDNDEDKYTQIDDDDVSTLSTEDDDLIAPDSWARCGGELLVDIIDDDGAKHDFLGRVVIPMAVLINADDQREQPLFEGWLKLSKMFDGSKYDRRLNAMAKRANTNELGEVYVRLELLLPDGNAAEHLIEMEEAKRADKGESILQKYRSLMTTVENMYNSLYHMNNKFEQFQNLFNWSHPRKTELVLILLSFITVLFIVIPSRFIILMFTIYLFTEHFRPLGVVKIKANHLIALLPTNDDMKEVITSGIVTAKRGKAKDTPVEVKETKKPLHRAFSKDEMSRHNSSMNNPSGSTTNINTTASTSLASRIKNSSLLKVSKSLPLPVLTKKGSSSNLKGSAIVLSDCAFSGHLRRKLPTSGMSSKTKWRREFYTVTRQGLLYWHTREQCEEFGPEGSLTDITSVHVLTSLREQHQIDPNCHRLGIMFCVETGTDTRTYLTANSEDKAEVWVAIIKQNCMVED